MEKSRELQELIQAADAARDHENSLRAFGYRMDLVKVKGLEFELRIDQRYPLTIGRRREAHEVDSTIASQITTRAVRYSTIQEAIAKILLAGFSFGLFLIVGLYALVLVLGLAPARWWEILPTTSRQMESLCFIFLFSILLSVLVNGLELFKDLRIFRELSSIILPVGDALELSSAGWLRFRKIGGGSWFLTNRWLIFQPSRVPLKRRTNAMTVNIDRSAIKSVYLSYWWGLTVKMQSGDVYYVAVLDPKKWLIALQGARGQV